MMIGTSAVPDMHSALTMIATAGDANRAYIASTAGHKRLLFERTGSSSLLATPLKRTLTGSGTATKSNCLAPGDDSKLQTGKVTA